LGSAGADVVDVLLAQPPSVAIASQRHSKSDTPFVIFFLELLLNISIPPVAAVIARRLLLAPFRSALIIQYHCCVLYVFVLLCII
jgi:hypothetical protein